MEIVNGKVCAKGETPNDGLVPANAQPTRPFSDRPEKERGRCCRNPYQIITPVGARNALGEITTLSRPPTLRHSNNRLHKAQPTLETTRQGNTHRIAAWHREAEASSTTNPHCSSNLPITVVLKDSPCVFTRSRSGPIVSTTIDSPSGTGAS